MEQRNLNGEMEYSVEERDVLAGHGIAIDTLRSFLRINGEMTLDAAIGGLLNKQAIQAEGGVVAGTPEAQEVLESQESPVADQAAE